MVRPEKSHTTAFPYGCTTLHSHQQCLKFLVAPHRHQHWWCQCFGFCPFYCVILSLNLMSIFCLKRILIYTTLRDMKRELISCWNSVPCSKLIVDTPPWPSIKGKKWLISCTVILPFHTLTPIPQFSVALESNMTDGFRNPRITFMGKSQQNYMRHWNFTQEYSSFHVHVLLPKENAKSPAGWLGPFCLMHRERMVVIFASWLLISSFLHPIASPPRFFFPFNPPARGFSRNVIKVIRISDMRCYVKVLHLPPLLLKPHWNSINP